MKESLIRKKAMKEIKFKKYSLKKNVKKCPLCKTLFRPTRKEYNYCSAKCGTIASRLRKGGIIVVRCDACGGKFNKKKSHISKSKYHYCSRKCYSQHRTTLIKGKRNPNWKNGISFQKSGVSGMGKNYRKGRYYENKSRKLLELQNYYTIRSAASKGLIDVIAINENEIRLIQVKSGVSPFTKKEKKGFHDLRVPLNCKKELWKWKRKLTITTIS